MANTSTNIYTENESEKNVQIASELIRKSINGPGMNYEGFPYFECLKMEKKTSRRSMNSKLVIYIG